MKKRFWTNAETQVLRKTYANTPTREIAERLDRNIESVYAKASKLSLKKDPVYIKENGGRLTGDVGVQTRFQKGNVPWNKGTKGVSGVHPNTRKTQFKKGQMGGAAQAGYKPIGSVRITKDDQLQRKVTDDPEIYPARRWIAVTRLVWEAEHGPVPQGHIVRFKPGMHTTVEEEITLDRIECICRSENMKRNTIHKYPEHIKDAMRARGVLNRRINYVEKHQRSTRKDV